MTPLNFSAAVNAWVNQTKERAQAVFRESTQRVIDEAQKPVAGGGNMPVDTGFLRRSILATIGEPNFPSTSNPDSKAKYAYDGSQVTLTIAKAKLGDKISAVWTANYARFVEYGTSRTRARRFVGLAAQRWKRIVQEVTSEARSRSK